VNNSVANDLNPGPRAYLGVRGPLAIAHRGGNREYAENSMAAFEHAIGLGYLCIETDVHVTHDGVLVAFHDDNLRRMVGVNAPIKDLNWTDVRGHCLAGGEPIPRLEDLLSAWPNALLTIDPKSDGAIEPLLSILAQFDAVKRVCVGSFSHQRLVAVRERFGATATTSASPREVFSLRAASLGIPKPYLPRFGADCLQVPIRHYGVPVVDRWFVQAAHERGLPVQVWTVNNPQEMRRLLDLGVDAIMTDDVQTLAGVFNERDLPLHGQRHTTISHSDK
jgi:glycerophosphoryl diester phosphodiesterase